MKTKLNIKNSQIEVQYLLHEINIKLVCIQIKRDGRGIKYRMVTAQLTSNNFQLNLCMWGHIIHRPAV